MDAVQLRSQFPDRLFLLRAIRSVAPLEAAWLEDPDISDEALYSSAARLLSTLELNLSEEKTLETIAKDAGVERIQGHTQFFAACCEELDKSRSLRVTIVGPTFLEPMWLHDREAEVNPRPDFTKALRARLFAKTLAPCELILRNNRTRYEANLREYVAGPEEWDSLLEEMIEDSYTLFGERGERGPRIRCIDPGYSHLPHIFDNIVLIGTRRSPTERVAGGWRMTDEATVAAEKERWNDLFEYAGHQADAVAQLREFIRQLRPNG